MRRAFRIILWLLASATVSALLARVVLYTNRESVTKMTSAADRAAARIEREVHVRAVVKPEWTRSFSSDSDRIDAVVLFPRLSPTVDVERLRLVTEDIVRDEFKGQKLFSIRLRVGP